LSAIVALDPPLWREGEETAVREDFLFEILFEFISIKVIRYSK